MSNPQDELDQKDGGTGENAPLTFGQLSCLRSGYFNASRGPWRLEDANLAAVWPLPEGLTEADVRAAWLVLVTEYESLRTMYDMSGPYPVQIVQKPELDGRLVTVTLDDANGDEQRVAYELRETVLDFHKEQPWRAAICLRDGAPKFLAMVVNHIAADGFALGLLRNQFFTLLDGGTLPPSQRLVDYAREQRTSQASQDALEYWVSEWDTFVAEDRVGHDTSPRVRGVMSSAVAARAAQETSQRLKISTPTVVLGAACLVLSSLKQRDRFTIGLLSSNRFEKKSLALMASIVQLAPVTVHVDPQAELDEYLTDIYMNSLEAYEHGSYDVDALKQRLEDLGVGNPEPMEFDCYFNFIEDLAGETDGPSATSIEWLANTKQAGSRFTLFVGGGEPMPATLRASADYLAPPEVATFLGALEAALVSFGREETELLADVDLKPVRPLTQP